MPQEDLKTRWRGGRIGVLDNKSLQQTLGTLTETANVGGNSGCCYSDAAGLLNSMLGRVWPGGSVNVTCRLELEQTWQQHPH